MTKQYTKKPVTIEAVEWNGDNIEELTIFTQGKAEFDLSKKLIIPTLEGDHIANIGDYIIKGIKGEFYPCKPDIFKATYEDPDKDIECYLALGQKDSKEMISIPHNDFSRIRKFVDNSNLNRIEIDLQSAPISEVGVDGMQIDDAILVIAEIIKTFNSKFPCRENSIVITKLEEAHLWCLKRKIDREKRGVEGKNIK